MNRKGWLLVVCVLGVVLIASGQKSETKTDTTIAPHYQLITARTDDNGTATEMVLLLDSSRGRVWRYSPMTESKAEKVIVPEAFQPIGIGVIDLRLPGNGLKNSADEAGGR